MSTDLRFGRTWREDAATNEQSALDSQGTEPCMRVRESGSYAAIGGEGNLAAHLVASRLLDEHPNPMMTVTETGHVRYANNSARALGEDFVAGHVLPPVLLDFVNRAAVTCKPVTGECSIDERTLAVTVLPGMSETSLYIHDTTAHTLSDRFNRALNNINQLVHSLHDFEEIMQTAVREATAALRAETAAVSLRTPKGWVLSFVHGLSPEVVGSQMSDEEEPHALLALSQRAPVAVDDAWNDPRVNQSHMRKWGVRAALALPLMVRGEPLGVAFFNYHGAPQAFNAAHIDFGIKLAASMSLAVDNARLFKELKERELGLRHANQRKNEFLATLSHELRNPLAPIKNSLFVLGRAPTGSRQSQHAITVVERQVGLLANLVDDLLDISRVTNGKINLHRRRLNLNELVRRTVDDNRSLCEKAGVRLDLWLAATEVHVNGDATRLHQIVENLLQNAIKFTDFGGQIRVFVEASASSAIIRIGDSGVGMAFETLEGLFEPFMQGPQPLEKSKGGLGLGLALVKGLVELHDGTITAHSNGLECGSEFTVVLPLDRNARPASLPPPPCAQSMTPRRILIIEDNVDAADSLRDVLELSDHVVEVAYDGQEGLARMRDFQPQVVLCDIGLPDMNGYELARTLRRDETFNGSYLIALTGYALPEDLARARAAGFDCHLAKPIAPDELEKALGQVETLGEKHASLVTPNRP